MFTILNNLKVNYPEFDIAGTIDRLKNLTEIINIPESQYTACHNDLLADNFILINEDARHKYDSPMYIIDWEYGGMAPRYYDMGDMFQEILVPREAEKDIIAEYSKGDNFDQTLYYIDLYKPFPDIYWFLWSLIQLNISKIEFDYYNYGKVKYENAIGNLEFIKKGTRRHCLVLCPISISQKSTAYFKIGVSLNIENSKHQITNSKQYPNSKLQRSKQIRTCDDASLFRI